MLPIMKDHARFSEPLFSSFPFPQMLTVCDLCIMTTKAKHILFLLKFKQKHALSTRCSGSVVRLRKPLVSSASGPFFTVNTLSYHLLSVTPSSMSMHLEKQQKPHHVITSATFNSRNHLYMVTTSSSQILEYKAFHKNASNLTWGSLVL